MVVILEGMNRTGKTTIAKALQERGFISIKEESRAATKGEAEHTLKVMFTMLKALAPFVDIVIDRLHLTEKVYGHYFRGYQVSLLAVEPEASSDMLMVYTTDTIENIVKRLEDNQKVPPHTARTLKHDYDLAYNLSKLNKIQVNIGEEPLEEVIEKIIGGNYEHHGQK